MRLHIVFLKKNGILYTWLAHDFQYKFHWGIHCLCETSLVWHRFKETKELFMAVCSAKSVQYLSLQQWNCVCSNWTSRSVGMQIAEDQEPKLYAKITCVCWGGGLFVCYFMTVSVQGVIYSQKRWCKRHLNFWSVGMCLKVKVEWHYDTLWTLAYLWMYCFSNA